MSSDPLTTSTQFDLFLDESGTFLESSSTATPAGKAKRFPSQLTGVLVPNGELTNAVAEQILENCHEAAGLPLAATVHAAAEVAQTNDSTVFNQYNRRIGSLLSQLRERGWQPVRLVNREGVNFGGKPQTYTNMVAELFVKICKQKRNEGLKRIGIRLFCAEVQVADNRGKFRLRSDVYSWRIKERKALIAIRQGYASESSDWDLVSLDVVDARTDRRLQICDLLSHASHDNFRWCTKKTTRPLFEETLGAHNWTLIVREWLERAAQLIEERSLGLALITLVEHFTQEDRNESTTPDAGVLLERVLDDLAEMESSIRDSQLSIILSWIEQLISLQRSTALGYKLVKWLQEHVLAPLAGKLETMGRASEIDWFAFALHLWALTACNHRGTLFKGKDESAQLDLLNSRLGGRWEHSKLLMEGLVAQAVHLTDCFDFDQASARMELVAQHYGGLSSLFSQALPGLFPQRIQSDLRGKALGTWMQSECFAGALDSTRLVKARQLNEEAITEFSTLDDKNRQRQYRCHLETLARDFDSAREYLAKSLGLEESSHEAVASAIESLADQPPAQGFALAHWLHLGASLLLEEAGDSSNFLTALDTSGLLDSRWCVGQVPEYPAHSILRRVATIYAFQDDPDRAVATLEALNVLDPIGKEQLIVAVIQLAAITEVVALLWEKHNPVAQQLIDSNTESLTPLLAQIKNQAGTSFTHLNRILDRWEAALTELQSDPDTASIRSQLLSLAQLVGY